MLAPYPIDAARVAALYAIRDRLPGNDARSGRARLLEALQTLGHVTTFEAMRFLDVFDPRPRKLELVRLGFPIELHWRQVATESGKSHRIGLYAMNRTAEKGAVP
jgi:hypothetical protein